MTTPIVEDVMVRDFAKISKNMPVVEATNLLLKKPLMGSPILDEDGKLEGWLSEQDCLRMCYHVLYHNQRMSTVESVMSTDVLTVSESTDILDLASRMLEAKPKVYPVINSAAKVVGVISRRKVLEVLDKLLVKDK